MNLLNIQEMFHHSVDNFNKEVAISSTNKSITYGELEKKANRLGNFLLDSGVSKGDVVAILVGDIVEAITSMIAVLKAGGTFVPLDASLPEKRLEAMIEVVAPACFIIERSLLGKINYAMPDGGKKAKVICLDDCEAGAEAGLNPVSGYSDYQNTSRPSTTYAPDDMCYIYFTSGSTGKPKGIAGRMKGIDHFIRWEIENLGVTRGTRVSQMLPLSFDGSLRDLFVPLCAGGTVCVPEGRETLLDAEKLVEWIDQQQINIIHCVPSLFRSIINQATDPSLFQALKYILLAGEPLLPTDVGRWTEVFQERTQLINLYGTSETTMAKFIYFVNPVDKDRPSIPIGQPMTGARAVIMDEKGNACPPGVVGEIYIRTPYRSLGYYNQPELTKEVFIQNPFSDDPTDIVYKTGDLGRMLDDGNYEYLGRRDQQVKVRGIRVELAEIESLLRGHEAVKDVAVVDQDSPDGSKYLCAYAVLGQEVEVGALRDHLSDYLPDYMVPSAFLIMDQLPRTISGKVDRRALPVIRVAQANSDKNYVAPRNPIEEVVAGIWSRVLGLPRVSITDNFFQLGGHSLLATQIISRIRSVFQVEVPLQTLFESPTLVNLAQKIEEAFKAGSKLSARIEKAERDDTSPVSFAQQRLWFIDQLDPGSPAYNIINTSRLQGKLNVNALEQAVSEILRRHETLRTKFATKDGMPVQIVAAPQRFDMPLIDLTTLSEDEREEKARLLAEADSLKRFDLSTGPLVSIALIKLNDKDHVLLFTMHHIIGDAWSSAVLVREIAQFYREFCEGKSSSLAELPVQYADFAVWQRQSLQGETLDTHLNYWRQQLSGTIPTVELPTDFPRPDSMTYSGAVESVVVEKPILDALKKLSLTEGATLFMTLLAGFNVLLYRYTGQEDIIVGTDVANRNSSEVEDIVGFFINQLVLRTNLSGNPTFKELIGRVREVSLNAYAHQDLPFEKLVEELKPERNLSRTPLFQMKILLQNVPQGIYDLPGLTLVPFGSGAVAAPFDLVVTMVESPEGMVWDVIYSTELFQPSTIKRLMDHFKSLLANITANPNQRLSELRILDEAETGRFKASDFPEAGLSQMEFERLVLEIGKQSSGD